VAEQALRGAVVHMTTFQADGEWAAVLGAESAKEWKGEPYEKLAAFLTLGTLLYAKGDHGNALAMYKSAVLADTGTAEERYRSDFVPAWLMQALVYQAEREHGNAEQSMGRAIDSLWSRYTIGLLTESLMNVQVAADPNSLNAARALLFSADQALYLAKSEGRNRVCLSLASSSDLIKVGFCPAAFTSPYYGDVLAGLEDVVKEIKRIELSVRAPEHESDYRVLKTLFRRFVRDKPDAIAVCTQSPTAVQDLQILHQADIPVFFFNVPEKIGDRCIRSYIGYDQAEAGKAVGKYLARLLRGRGRLASEQATP